MNRKLIHHWWMGGGVEEDYGLLTALWNVLGNLSTNIQIKLSYVGNPQTEGNWNANTGYNAGVLKVFPTNSDRMWRVKRGETVGTSENPPISNPKWELAIGADVIFELGPSIWARLTLQRDGGEWVKMGPIEIGAPTDTKFAYTPVLANYNSAYSSTTIGTSTALSISIPTSHPSSRTVRLATGLSGITNSSTLGTCTDSFAIPTSHPEMMTRNLPSGLGLVSGDTIVFYGNANNFCIMAVARYYNDTGISDLATIQHCGTGTFSSWTVKKEQYRRISRTSNAAQHFHGLVQSYDGSGNGDIVINSVKNTGSVTVADWTVSLAKEVAAPTSSQATQANALDAEAVGYFYTVDVNGTGFEHNCTTDNRGTGLRGVYAGGPLINNPPADVIIDTYSATLISSTAKVAFDNLGVGSHKFFFVSIPSPSGLSANTRTWVKSSTNPSNVQTMGQFYNTNGFAAAFQVCGHGQSVGEFAWRFRKNANAGDNRSWMPFHGSFTMTSLQQFVVDNVTVDVQQNFTTGINPYALKYQPFTNFRLDQSGTIIHPQVVESLGTYTSFHKADKKGFDMEIVVDWTVDVFVETKYLNMLFLTKAFGKKIKFDRTSAVYTSPQGVEANVSINSLDLNPGSVLAYTDTGSNGEPLYALANYSGGTEISWTSAEINNYDATYVKLYPKTDSNIIVLAGTREIVRSKWYVGNRGSL